MTLNKSEVIALDSQYHAGVYGRLKICLVKGEGCRVWDSEGNEYLDCLAGIAVNNVGHCHPKVTEAICRQARTLMHCSNLYYIEPQARLAEKLVGLLPRPIERIFFCNSGTESVEAAMKLIRRASGKPGIIAAHNSFHGRTFGSLAVTGQEKYRKPFEPLVPGARFVPFGDIDSLTSAIDEEVGGIILEPIQGEGGIRTSTEDYLRAVREVCDDEGLYLAFDEVQTGMGRTGNFLACQSYGVIPDIVSMAKGLGGGFPIGAMAARSDVMAAFHPSDHASTFGGNPLACAAALAALNVLTEEGLMENARTLGAWALDQIREMQRRHPDLIEDVRGRGLMLGIEMASEDLAKKVFDHCMRERILVNRTAGKVIRLVPPLLIERQDLAKALHVVEAPLN